MELQQTGIQDDEEEEEDVKKSVHDKLDYNSIKKRSWFWLCVVCALYNTQYMVIYMHAGSGRKSEIVS